MAKKGAIFSCDDKRFKSLSDVWNLPTFKLQLYGTHLVAVSAP